MNHLLSNSALPLFQNNNFKNITLIFLHHLEEKKDPIVGEVAEMLRKCHLWELERRHRR